jgi:hypothetical protein
MPVEEVMSIDEVACRLDRVQQNCVAEKLAQNIKAASASLFFVRKRVKEVRVQKLNTPRGSILISTPEATAVDLVGYAHHAGGLDNVATILAELAGKLDPAKLVEAAETAPVPWVQRLGYLLDRIDPKETSGLKRYVRGLATKSVGLLTNTPVSEKQHDADWKLYVDADLESEACSRATVPHSSECRDAVITADIRPLLTAGFRWDMESVAATVLQRLIEALPEGVIFAGGWVDRAPVISTL